MTLFVANVLVAMLAGFLGRASDGHPGQKFMTEGLGILDGLVENKRRLFAKADGPGGHRPRPRRKFR